MQKEDKMNILQIIMTGLEVGAISVILAAYIGVFIAFARWIYEIVYKDLNK